MPLPLQMIKQHEEYSRASSIKMIEVLSPSSPPITFESSPSPSLWDLLPDDIAAMIFANLHTGDRVRMMLVCKSWRETLLREDIPVAATEIPWRILSDASYSKAEYHLTAIRFNSLSENRIYSFDLPAGSGRWCCCGSSNGWLLMARTRERALLSAEIMLWNPIAGCRRKLPALSTLAFYPWFLERAEVESVSNFIKEVVVLEFPTTNVVAVVFSHPVWGELERYLALCTPQDQRWTFMFGSSGRSYKYVSLCCHKGKLCVLVDVADIRYPDRRDAKTFYMVELTGCVVEMEVIWYNYRDYTRHISCVDLYYDNFGISIYERVQYHLVGLSSGDLAIVIVVLDACEYERLVRIQTGNFEVRVVLNNSFNKLCCIGNEAIFVGCSSSISVEASSDGVDGECIYFATEDGKKKVQGAKGYMYRIREEGVFNVKENRMQVDESTDLPFYSGSFVGWFTPKLFQR